MATVTRSYDHSRDPMRPEVAAVATVQSGTAMRVQRIA